jgi:predicted AlkP superfamily phosphohydrolase/phosphomutase
MTRTSQLLNQRPRLRPALVLGLDGATFDVIRPLAQAGRLPNLSAWLKEGASALLHSTVPPVSFPAWSSFATGLDPGAHGLFDFTQKLPGRYALRFTNASDRSGATLFGRVTAAGGRVLALGMPATFPPEPVDGLLVAGFDAPVSTGSSARAASDPALYEAIAARAGPWMRAEPDENAAAEGWHESAVDRLLARIAQKSAFAQEALAQLYLANRAPDLVCVVFSESDTVAHHFWRDHDPASPRHDPKASAKRRGAVAAVYEALDAACGELRAALGPSAACFVVSDHGAGGAARRVVHLNRRLEEAGLLAFRSGARARDRLARAARDTALRLLPPRAREAAFRRLRPAAAKLESAARFGGFEWARTAAFSEEANTQPGVWINLAGREEAGCVAPADYERARDDVIAALLGWRLLSGEPVVARARRREEVYTGPHVERAPDVVVELGLDAGYGLSVVPTPRSGTKGAVTLLSDSELGGGRGRGMNGTHRPEGVWIEHGTGAPAFPSGHGALTGAAAAILRTMGVALDDGAPAPRAPRAYTAAEEAIVAERLRRLGYLD